MTDFFATSGVQLPQHNSGLFHFRHSVYSAQLKSKCGNLLAKTAALRINLNLDGTSITSQHQTKIDLINMKLISCKYGISG